MAFYIWHMVLKYLYHMWLWPHSVTLCHSHLFVCSRVHLFFKAMASGRVSKAYCLNSWFSNSDVTIHWGCKVQLKYLGILPLSWCTCGHFVNSVILGCISTHLFTRLLFQLLKLSWCNLLEWGCQRIYTWGHSWFLYHWGPMVDFAKSSSISFLPAFTPAKSTFFIHSTNFDMSAPSKISMFVNKWLFKLLCVIAVMAFRSSFWFAWLYCRVSPSAHIDYVHHIPDHFCQPAFWASCFVTFYRIPILFWIYHEKKEKHSFL